MNKRLFVGNLPWRIRDEELRDLFLPHGEVHYARVVADPDSGRSRGFGFVEMADESGAQIALEVLEGMRIDGRELHLEWDRKAGEGEGQHGAGRRDDRDRDRGGSRGSGAGRHAGGRDRHAGGRHGAGRYGGERPRGGDPRGGPRRGPPRRRDDW